MKSMKRWARELAFAAGLAACVSGSLVSGAMAQEGKLPMVAMPEVIRQGETAQVDVYAAFSNTMYAFAGAEFAIGAVAGAGAGVWNFVSDGVILGDQVWGIDVGQAHMPQAGVLADPSNPLRVWNGRYTATSAAPALVELRAFPSSFDVYPSKLTSSSVPCEMEGGNAFVMVNPLSVGAWSAAPGRGTRAGVVDDVWVDGRIITGENPSAAILMALLLPAVQSAPEGEGVRVAFDGLPTEFAHEVRVSRGEGRPHETMSLNYKKIEYNNQAVGFELTGSESGTKRAEFQGFLGGVSVAVGDVNNTGADAPARLIVDRVPDEVHVRVGPHVKVFDGSSQSEELIWTLVYDKPVEAQIYHSNWRNYRVSVDTIEVRKPVKEAAARMRTSNNLKQLGLGMHTFEAKGVRNMRLGPVQPE